jgi:hypothetical protein
VAELELENAEAWSWHEYLKTRLYFRCVCFQDRVQPSHTHRPPQMALQLHIVYGITQHKYNSVAYIGSSKRDSQRESEHTNLASGARRVVTIVCRVFFKEDVVAVAVSLSAGNYKRFEKPSATVPQFVYSGRSCPANSPTSSRDNSSHSGSFYKAKPSVLLCKTPDEWASTDSDKDDGRPDGTETNALGPPRAPPIARRIITPSVSCHGSRESSSHGAASTRVVLVLGLPRSRWTCPRSKRGFVISKQRTHMTHISSSDL